MSHHTDILLGDDGRGSMFWKIICDGRVQEVNAPIPEGYQCRYCGQTIYPVTRAIPHPKAGGDEHEMA